jgi:hypothetical protein
VKTSLALALNTFSEKMRENSLTAHGKKTGHLFKKVFISFL